MDALDTLLQLGALSRLPRTGWLLAGIEPPESVADHALGTALVALVLGARVEPALRVERAVALAVVHDAPEALLTDLPRTAAGLLPAGAKRQAEDRAAERLFARAAPPALELWAEYRAGETREARFVRVCDRLQLGLQTLAYARAGRGALDDFRAGLVALDTDGFAPCEELRERLVAALASTGSAWQDPRGERPPPGA